MMPEDDRSEVREMMNNSLVRAGLAQGRIVRLAVCGIAALVCWLNPATLSAASITYVQGNNSDPQASETSVNVTYTAAQAAGDLNVIAVGWNDSTATVSSVTDTKGNVYTRAVGPTAISGLESQSIYYAKNIAAAAAGANSVTVTFSVAAAFPDIRILEYNGADPTNPVDVTAAASGDSATSSSGAVTTTNATDLIFGANIVQTSTTGPGTGFTSRMLTSPDGDIAEDEMVTATGSYSATAALTSGQWIMQMVAFRTPASGTGAPTVTSVSPNSGSTAGGTAVTITGTNFATGATVTFGTAAATNVAVVNSTTITATTPAGSAGAVTVTVTVSGQSGSLASGFTYALAPTVTGVSPNSGSTLGGTAVTITGTNFLTGATVTFGGTAATNVVVVSSTSITATTPAGSAGAVTVTVTVGGQSGSLASGFTYAVFPTVTSVSPIGGPTAGGTAVTITGTNFATGATVTFGSDGSDQRGGGQQHLDHGHLSGGQRGRGDGDSDGQRAQRQPGEWVHLYRCADSDRRFAEQRVDGGRNSGHDHRNKLRHGSYRDGWRNGGDERSGGQRNPDHGDDPGGQCGGSDSDSDESGCTERELGQRVHLCDVGDSERAYQPDGCRRRPRANLC
jgi:hypothetical protein